jgi:hypothetical protein
LTVIIGLALVGCEAKQTDNENTDCAEVQAFYDRLVASPDYLCVIGEEFIPEGMTVEQYEAESTAKAQMALEAAKEKIARQPVAQRTVAVPSPSTVKERSEALEKMYPEMRIRRLVHNEDLSGRELESV